MRTRSAFTSGSRRKAASEPTSTSAAGEQLAGPAGQPGQPVAADADDVDLGRVGCS